MSQPEQDWQAGISYMENSDGTVAIECPVVLKNALILLEGGTMVGKLDATFNFENLDPRLHQRAIRAFQTHFTGVKIFGLSQGQIEIEQRRSARYWQRRKAYKALPWYKKLFTSRPWLYDLENDEEAAVGKSWAR